MSCGVGCRRGSNLVLLWLRCRPAAPALTGILAWELPSATGVALKKKKRKKRVTQCIDELRSLAGRGLCKRMKAWENNKKDRQRLCSTGEQRNGGTVRKASRNVLDRSVTGRTQQGRNGRCRSRSLGRGAGWLEGMGPGWPSRGAVMVSSTPLYQSEGKLWVPTQLWGWEYEVVLISLYICSQ